MLECGDMDDWTLKKNKATLLVDLKEPVCLCVFSLLAVVGYEYETLILIYLDI